MAKKQRTILRIGGVSAVTGLPHSSVYALVKAGKLPPPVRIAGTRRSGWDSEAIAKFVETQLDGKAA